jgi:aminopeptidase N
MKTDSAVPVRLADYTPYPFEIVSLHLLVRLDARATRVTSTLRVQRKAKAKAKGPFELNGDCLACVSVALDGNRLNHAEYSATPDGFTLPAAPDCFTLEIVTELDPVANTALSGLYQSGGNWCTQCEAEGFRRITYYPDRPDVMSVFTVRLEAETSAAPVLLANGNLVESGALEQGRHYAIWHDPWPKPAYLFALVAGNLALSADQFVTRSGRNVALGIYTEHGKQHLTAYAMDALKRSMRWDEEKYGCEYDLDVFNIVAVSDFNMGAMENKGLNIFNDRYVLADPDTATDADYASIEAIIAHEYFHNWTGNRITCRDWFQLCLKEGLTVFRDHEFSADMRSKPVKRITEIRLLQAQQFPEDGGPLAHPVRPSEYVEINNFYTATVYEKGSEVVRMLQTILGESTFRQGLTTYLKRHDGEAATVEQFVKCFEDVSGEDLSQFFLWYEQAGTPELGIKTHYDSAAQSFAVTLQQKLNATPGQTYKLPMHIPVAFSLLGPNGDALVYDSVTGGDVRAGTLHLKQGEQTFIFSGIGSKPVLSALRGLSAPVKRAGTLNSADQLFLAKHDTDLVSRWQALNDLELCALSEMSRTLQNGDQPNGRHELIDAKGAMAVDKRLDPHFRALILASPSESEIARGMAENVNVGAIHKARTHWMQLLAHSPDLNRTNLAGALSGQMRPKGAFSPDAKQAGARAIANGLLELECIKTGEPQLAFAAFQSATNMTDRLAALTILAMNFPEAEATHDGLAAFRARFDGNALVLDKWLALIAAMPGQASLSRVKAALTDPVYDQNNPNRVRSLIGTFAMANPTGFHRPDGLAYEFFVGQMIDLDQRNPQIAARLMTSLRSWRALEANSRDQLRAAIATIATASGISRDLADIAKRTLG